MSKLSTLLISAGAALAFVATPIYAQDISEIEFGDDSGNWTEDGECDDPRFEGEGMASTLSQSDVRKDATDCKSLMASGQITFSDTQFDPFLTVFEGISLGDNSYEWANDDQCDDARFEGEGMAVTPSRDAIEKDRDDCSYGLQTGALTAVNNLPPPAQSEYEGIDFGHDKGSYPNDGECDDPRFIGQGMGTVALSIENVGTDRKDCLAAFKADKVVLKANQVVDGVFFGDDSNFYANDGECDDLRFTGAGMSAKPTPAGVQADATDCMAGWRAKRIEKAENLDINGYLIKDGIAFGDDSGRFANDNECDDPSFSGKGVVAGSSPENAGKDRTDCLAGYEAGTIKLAPAIPVDRSINVNGIRFGDDEGAFAQDGECDDPRFEGEGMATVLDSSDSGHDATDCLILFQSGDIRLK